MKPIAAKAAIFVEMRAVFLASLFRYNTRILISLLVRRGEVSEEKYQETVVLARVVLIL